MEQNGLSAKCDGATGSKKTLCRIMLRVASFAWLVAFGPTHVAMAQSITAKEWEAIQASGQYIIGVGQSSSVEQARQFAMNDMAGKICTRVQSQFDYVLKQNSGGKDGLTSEEKMKAIVRTYTSVTLNNVSEYQQPGKASTTVYRYMKQSELRAMFRRRIAMAKKWAVEAQKREKEHKIGDALQDYYWALALLRSCPDGDLETLDDGESGQNMTQEVFQRVKDILSGMSVKASSVVKEGSALRVTLQFHYNGQPAVNFNYRYFDGKRYSAVYTAKDGLGEVLLPPNVKMGKLKVWAEYEMRDEANIHPELRTVMEQTERVPFKAAELSVDTKGCPSVPGGYVMQIATGSGQAAQVTVVGEAQAPKTNVARHASPAVSAVGRLAPLSDQQAKAYLPAMRAVEDALLKHDFQQLESHFTPEGWDMFCKLIQYGDAKLLRSPVVQFFSDRGQVVCRSFPMSFSFKGNHRSFTEDVVFCLNADGKVTEVAFALEQAAVSDIVGREDWSPEARLVMVRFLETYKTAYALKRLDYISGIFSNEALIITGSLVKGTGRREVGPSKMAHVKYTRQTKAQYMENLRRCFASNEYVNIHFADNVVRRSHTNPDIYGIQIKQDYFSSSYGDTGYLFLLIDFANPERPVIHVRTWQPDNDPNVRDGRIGIADFQI